MEKGVSLRAHNKKGVGKTIGVIVKEDVHERIS
jgi:hypothetical protein